MTTSQNILWNSFGKGSEVYDIVEFLKKDIVEVILCALK